MKNKIATYRIQFNKEFNFSQCKNLVSYFSRLGVNEIYASPIFRPIKGSNHGYNIINPNQINPEIGTYKEFKELNKSLKKRGISWLQDIVPNHMAYENDYLYDVFEKGKDSQFWGFFDIDWYHPKFNGKVIAPFLGSNLNSVIDNSELIIDFEKSLFIKYYEHKFPINNLSYQQVFDIIGKELEKNKSEFAKKIKKKITEQISIKENLDKILRENKELKETALNFLNKKSNIKGILKEQYYSLEYWKNANKNINYRRFFCINDLICLNIHENKVFKKNHELIFRLAREGFIDSLRVDHLDGLYDPKEYLKRLRRNFKDRVIAEKILVKGERLPDFKMDGTTGYDFLNYLNWIFIKKPNEFEFDRTYQNFVNRESFEKELYKSKKYIVNQQFKGEIDNLTRNISYCLSKNKKPHDKTKLKRAIKELILWMPIYRTYVSKNERRKEDIILMKALIEGIKSKHKSIKRELQGVEFLFENDYKCFMNFQKYTGSVMAKGFEDTALYRYTRLLSLNEVGGDPAVFGIPLRKFHKFNRQRTKKPLTMNTTSTHDTKRGEDVRARLNVLSEFPREWGRKLNKWHRLNKKRRGEEIRNEEEYYIYQIMLGSFPFYKRELNNYKRRIKEHMIKATREAGKKTSWINPQKDFEKSLIKFIENLFQHKKFLDDFLQFQQKIAFFGVFNSISQLLIKSTSPGVPDFYQGTELWDFNLTDPDNRRNIDFEKRVKYSAEEPDLKKYLRKYKDGKIKLHLTKKILHERSKDSELYMKGEYTPLEVEGKHKSNIVAYARKYKERFSVVIAPRCLSFVVKYPEFPLGKCWRDTRVKLPKNLKGGLKDIFTGTLFKEKEIYVSEAFNKLPFAILSKCQP